MEHPLELVHVHWLDDQRVCSAMIQSIMVVIVAGLDLQGTAT